MTEGRSLKELVAIDPVTGEFDVNLIPEDQRAEVLKMADAMIDWNLVKKQKLREQQARDARKKRKKVGKTFGKNKRRKK